MGVDVELLDRLTAAISGACPCGGNPRDDSIYCSYDCEPNHVSVHTDQRETGEYATPMRWRPDLVTAVDDSGLTLLAQRRRGPCNAQVFEHGDLIHLRLDDGHRFVGVDVEPGDERMPGDYWKRPNWVALERELGNSRHVEADPWADVMGDAIERFNQHIDVVFALAPPTAGMVSVAPTGTNPNDRSAWTDLGVIVDDGLTWGDDTVIRTDLQGWGTTDQGPVTMTLDNRYAVFRPFCADVGMVTSYDIEIDAAEGVPLLDALVVAESEASLRERARLLVADHHYGQGEGEWAIQQRLVDRWYWWSAIPPEPPDWRRMLTITGA